MTPYYQDGAVTIYHGDCREIVPTLGRFACVITDPPFSDSTHSNAKSNRGKGHGNVAIDFPAIDFPAIDATLAMLADHCERWLISSMDWRHIAAVSQEPPVGWEFVRFGVWVKTNPMPQISADRPAQGWEGIAYMHRAGVRKVWSGGGCHGNWIGALVTNGDHPTGKPLAMIQQWVERFTEPGDAILDPFAGSGTTGRAAKDLGRKAVLIEREERYCEIAARRMSQEVLALGGNA